MVINGFNEDTIKKALSFVINDDFVSKNNTKRLFETRFVSHSNKKNMADLNEKQTIQADNDFVNSMAFLYLKTFYGKTPDQFKTQEYKNECLRFNSQLEAHPNLKEIEQKIENCLDKGFVDYLNGELPQELFYKKIKDIGLSSDNLDHDVFVTPSFPTQARIYINPSMSDYCHLMTFIFEQAAKYELELGAKTRMKYTVGSSLDNLILYVSAKDFPKVVEILQDYGTRYPDKTKNFGDTLECLGRSEQDWFGFGFDPQRDGRKKQGTTTFNDAVNKSFNAYILPAIVLNNFEAISKNLSQAELLEIFKKACGESYAEDVVLTLQDSNSRKMFINQFCNLSLINQNSKAFTEQNKNVSDSERNGYSAEQHRFYNTQKTDYEMLELEKIDFILKNGKKLSISRAKFSKIFENINLRSCIKNCYNTPEKLNSLTKQAVGLWNDLAQNLPYLDKKYPFISNEMATVINEKHSQYLTIINDLCSETKTELAIEVANILNHLGKPVPKFHKLSRQEIEVLYIKLVGLDNVIDASSYVKSIETEVNKKNHVYINTLQNLRTKRGLVLYKHLNSFSNSKQKQSYLMSLSKNSYADLTSSQQYKLSSQKHM